jgi:glycerol-3-phosphate dehydrogenase
VLPHSPGMRPAWLLRLGLFLYDHIGGRRTLPGTQTFRPDGKTLSAGLSPAIKKAFAYSDCWVEDSRLVVLNAQDAAAHGAQILTRTRLIQAQRENGLWRATIRDAATGAETTLHARMLVNAAGPWVVDTIAGTLGVNTKRRTRLVKGSHIVVPRLYDGDHAYILQNPDRRIVFAIPYEHRFTLIGTTDLPYDADPACVKISPDETSYLCDSVARWFARAPTPPDVVWSYAGVRALFDDGAATASEVTRDYVLDLDAPPDAASLLSVFGGKITTYRRLAEHALEKLGVPGPSWTATKPLPGGAIPGDFDAWATAFAARHPHVPPDQARRLARAYGTNADTIASAPQGQDFGAGLTQAEVDYLTSHEFAHTAEDILFRRSKLGLHVPPETAARIESYLRASG